MENISEGDRKGIRPETGNILKMNFRYTQIPPNVAGNPTKETTVAILQ